MVNFEKYCLISTSNYKSKCQKLKNTLYSIIISDVKEIVDLVLHYFESIAVINANDQHADNVAYCAICEQQLYFKDKINKSLTSIKQTQSTCPDRILALFYAKNSSVLAPS